MDIDFGYNQNGNGAGTASDDVNGDGTQKTDLGTGKIDNEGTGDDINNGDGKDKKPNPDKNVNSGTINGYDKDSKDGDGSDKKDKDSEGKDDKTYDLQAGASIQIGADTYTVDENGNILDKNGNIYKEANQVKEWLDGFESVDEGSENEISIEKIQEAVGIDITDDKGKSIKFENTIDGIKAYVNAITESAREEHYKTAINTLYQKYPILNDVLNYYVANGNSLEGFGEVPDHSNITINDTNEAQQESIIRAAWKEQNRRGDIESYIQYLKSSGILLSTAKEELAAMQEADREYRDNLAKEAEKREQQQIAELEKYWNGVYDVIKSKKIAGYQIPDNIIINRNGQKLSVTPEDFFDYIYRVDKDGKSAYERDLAKETIESRRDDEILRAYLKFVGGNYSNLVDMAINKQKVDNLRFKAKERKTTSVRITKPAITNNKKDIDFGY